MAHDKMGILYNHLLLQYFHFIRNNCKQTLYPVHVLVLFEFIHRTSNFIPGIDLLDRKISVIFSDAEKATANAAILHLTVTTEDALPASLDLPLSSITDN